MGFFLFRILKQNFFLFISISSLALFSCSEGNDYLGSHFEPPRVPEANCIETVQGIYEGSLSIEYSSSSYSSYRIDIPRMVLRCVSDHRESVYVSEIYLSNPVFGCVSGCALHPRATIPIPSETDPGQKFNIFIDFPNGSNLVLFAADEGHPFRQWIAYDETGGTLPSGFSNQIEDFVSDDIFIDGYDLN